MISTLLFAMTPPGEPKRLRSLKLSLSVSSSRSWGDSRASSTQPCCFSRRSLLLSFTLDDGMRDIPATGTAANGAGVTNESLSRWNTAESLSSVAGMSPVFSSTDMIVSSYPAQQQERARLSVCGGRRPSTVQLP
jgi:hypothetical protein